MSGASNVSKITDNNLIALEDINRTIIVIDNSDKNKLTAPVDNVYNLNIVSDGNEVILQNSVTNVTVVDNSPGDTLVEVTQPYTTLIEIANSGLQGPKGDKGDVGNNLPFAPYGGNIWFTTSSILITGSETTDQIFLIKNPYTQLSVENSSVNGVVITSSAENILTVKNNLNQTLFNISGSGVYQFLTQSSAPSGEATPGKIWFTSTDFYVSLD
jgi:hypothetical protein